MTYMTRVFPPTASFHHVLHIQQPSLYTHCYLCNPPNYGGVLTPPSTPFTATPSLNPLPSSLSIPFTCINPPFFHVFPLTSPALYHRGREVKKSGGGGRNWGNDAAADVDSAAAPTEQGDGAGWGANGSAAAPSAEVRVDDYMQLFVGHHVWCFGILGLSRVASLLFLYLRTPCLVFRNLVPQPSCIVAVFVLRHQVAL